MLAADVPVQDVQLDGVEVVFNEPLGVKAIESVLEVVHPLASVEVTV